MTRGEGGSERYYSSTGTQWSLPHPSHSLVQGGIAVLTLYRRTRRSNHWLASVVTIQDWNRLNILNIHVTCHILMTRRLDIVSYLLLLYVRMQMMPYIFNVLFLTTESGCTSELLLNVKQIYNISTMLKILSNSQIFCTTYDSQAGRTHIYVYITSDWILNV